MSDFTPEQAQMLLAVELSSIEAERPVTRSVIAAIPPDKCDYTPDPVTRSAIELAWHIVMAENRFLEAVIDGAFDLTPRPRPDAIRTPADVNAWYDERLPRLVDRLKAVPGAGLARLIDFRGILKFPGRGVPADRPQPYGPPPRAALDVPTADGRGGPVDLRRELRRTHSP